MNLLLIDNVKYCRKLFQFIPICEIGIERKILFCLCLVWMCLKLNQYPKRRHNSKIEFVKQCEKVKKKKEMREVKKIVKRYRNKSDNKAPLFKVILYGQDPVKNTMVVVHLIQNKHSLPTSNTKSASFYSYYFSFVFFCVCVGECKE